MDELQKVDRGKSMDELRKVDGRAAESRLRKIDGRVDWVRCGELFSGALDRGRIEGVIRVNMEVGPTEG